MSGNPDFTPTCSGIEEESLFLRRPTPSSPDRLWTNYCHCRLPLYLDSRSPDLQRWRTTWSTDVSRSCRVRTV